MIKSMMNHYHKNIIVKLVAFCIAVISVISLCACSPSETKDKKIIKVGIAMYDEYDQFTNRIASEIQRNISELAAEDGATVVCDIVYSGKSQFQQNEQISDFIRKEYDVLCVNIFDRTDAMQIIDMAKNADVPIIFFNREIVKEDLWRWDKLYYVGANPAESGRFQAEIIKNAFEDESRVDSLDFNHDGVIQYVMLEGEAGHQDALIRTSVSVESIKEAGRPMEKLGDEIANWNREQAYTKMMSILAGHPWQIELVIANDDNIALGALDALKEYKVPELPLIVGVNGQLEVMEKIKAGEMTGTVYNNAYGKGEVIGKMAYGLGRYGKIPDSVSMENGKYYFVPYEKVDANNVDEYIERAVY